MGSIDRKRLLSGVAFLVILAAFHFFRNSDARACQRELKYQIRMAPESKDEMIKSCIETIRFMRAHHLQ
jgi:hypothetical protein